MISSAKSLFPNIHIGMSAILPRPVDYNKTNKKVVEVNKALSVLCQRYGVEFIHSFKYFVKGGKPLVELFAYKNGGLHLNVEGSKQFCSYFKRRVAHMH